MKEALLKYVEEKYGTLPEYLWKRYPEFAVLRHKNNRKWYAVIMNVTACKLGLDGDEEVWIVNVKTTDRMFHDYMTGQDGFFPGYHMNKAIWLSILLDGTVAFERITALIDESYEAVSPKP